MFAQARSKHRVSDVQVYHACFSAWIYADGPTHILTVSVVDFTRFSDITAVHPNTFEAAPLIF